MKIAMGILPAALTFLLTFTGCGTQKTPEKAESASDTTETTTVSLIAVERSPAVEGAQVTITSPASGQVLPAGDSTVKFEVLNFDLGTQTSTPRAKSISNSGEGQHVHVIIDNSPYFACYESPCSVGPLAPGPHTLVAFPSRSYHESVKSDSAGQVINFHVGKAEGEFMLDPTQPTIIYSRPKGTYAGQDADSILLDFYLHNVELSESGYQAVYTITPLGGESQEAIASLTLSEWQPAMVTGLSNGDYQVLLELVDPAGNVVAGPFNQTSRTITVNREGMASAGHGGH